MITTKEAAARSGLTARRIRQLAVAGTIKAERVETLRGDVWLVDQDDLARYRRRTKLEKHVRNQREGKAQ